jgi:hypothetical protein
LGNPRISGAAALGWAALEAAAAQRDANLLPVIREIQVSGITSRNSIATALNARKVATARGRAWTQFRSARYLARAAT